MGTFDLHQPWTAFKCSSAHLSLLALGALEYQLVGVGVAVCVESMADSVVGGESAGETFRGLLASLTVQHPTPVDPADRGQAVVMGVLGILGGAGDSSKDLSFFKDDGLRLMTRSRADSRRATCLTEEASSVGKSLWTSLATEDIPHPAPNSLTLMLTCQGTSSHCSLEGC